MVQSPILIKNEKKEGRVAKSCQVMACVTKCCLKCCQVAVWVAYAGQKHIVIREFGSGCVTLTVWVACVSWPANKKIILTRKVCSSFIKCFQILLIVLANLAKWCQILPNLPKCCQFFSCFAKCCQVLPGVAKWLLGWLNYQIYFINREI